MICPRSYSKGGRARFQTEVSFQGPLLSITTMHYSQDGTQVLIQAAGSRVVHPTKQTMEEEEQASWRKIGCFGCTKFEYLWNAMRRYLVALVDISVKYRGGNKWPEHTGRQHYLDGFSFPRMCPQAGRSDRRGAHKEDRKKGTEEGGKYSEFGIPIVLSCTSPTENGGAKEKNV